MSSYFRYKTSLLTGWVFAGLMSTAVNLPAQSEPVATAVNARPDAWYPRTLSSDRGSIVLYAPQIKSWDNFEKLTAYMAFQISVNETGRSPFGTVKFTARTEVDLTNREVLLYGLEINELNIPGIEDFEVEYHVFREALQAKSKKVPLDLILEYLPTDLAVASTKGLAQEPPPIFVSVDPAILLSIDTEPIYLPAGESGLEFILNANWNVFRAKGSEDLHLLGPDGWLSATSLRGPWIRATHLPEAFRNLPDDPNWQKVVAALPEDLSSFVVVQSLPPKVIVTTEPSEVILFQGSPRWESIANTGVDYSTNTAAEVFRHDGEIFFLTSGRWFKTTGFDKGDWILEKQLPEAFQKIPADHAKAYVRASIPGTREAWEAALIATIPASAKFNRQVASELAPTIAYAGEPTFSPIEGTGIEVALNTSYQVLKYQGAYYLCYHATWFMSSQPVGPWSFADSIPEAFAAIPPSSPAHNTTYVKVEQSDEETITYSSTAGYTNSYVSESGTVVNGAGFVQSAAAVWLVYEIADDVNWHHYPYHPYYPWPPSYGYGSWYNPETGRYGESVVAYGPFGAGRSTAVYNPETGVYGRGQTVWDNDEMAGRRYAYNPNTDTSTSRRGYYDFDDNEGWSERVTRRGDEWVYAESAWEDGSLRTDIETSRGGEGSAYRERDGDTASGSGSFQTGSGQQIDADFSRERDGDTINTDRTISGENRSVDVSGSIEDGQGVFSLTGSDGGSGTVTRELEDGQLTGSGSFSKDGKTIESDTTRSAEGVVREFESSEGGKAVTGRQGDERGFVGETGSGDVYAGRDGEVYKKTESGWEQVDSGANAATQTRKEKPDAYGSGTRVGSETTSASAFAGRQAGELSSSRHEQLERDRVSRQRGYERYGSFQRSRSAQSLGAATTRARRR